MFRLFTKKYKSVAPEGGDKKFDAYVLFEAEQDTFRKQDFIYKNPENDEYKPLIYIIEIMCNDEIVNTSVLDISKYAKQS